MFVTNIGYRGLTVGSVAIILTACAQSTGGVMPAGAAPKYLMPAGIHHGAPKMPSSIGAKRALLASMAGIQHVHATGNISTIPGVNTPLPERPAWLRLTPDRATRSSANGIYTENFSAGTPVSHYALPNRSNAPPTCQTATGLSGVEFLGVDTFGNLWVPIQNDSPGLGYVQEYAPHCGTAMLQIPDPNGVPIDVAVDSKGNIYVGNIYDLDPSGNLTPGTVYIYSPTGAYVGELNDPSFSEGPSFTQQLDGVAVDSHDNCFVSHQDASSTGEVVKFRGCAPSTKGVVLAGVHPWAAGKPQLDASGNLLVPDLAWSVQYRLANIGVYAPPFDAPPSAQVSLYGPGAACPLGTSKTSVYCGDYVVGSVDVYSYPSGRYRYSFTNGIQKYLTAVATVPFSP